MNRFLSSAATIALCAFWASGCASMGMGDETPAKPAADAQPAAPDADVAAIEKSLPSDVPGEIERAHQLREHGAYEEAARSLAQIMLVAPDNPRAISEYGKTLVQQGRAREAVSFLKRAAQLSPNDWTVYSAMGVALDQAGDHADAKLAYNRALAIKPGEPSVLNNLAVSRALSGDVSGAQTILAKASTTGTDEPKIANNLAAIDAMRKPASSVVAPKPAAVASATPAAPMIQKPVTQAALPPATTPAAQPQKLASTNTAATAADEKKLGSGVVMQAVPVDPKAGPVAKQATHELADTKTVKKPVKKAAPPTTLASAKPALKIDTPALRTASDAN
jgi:Flp pilus assembly protein TadD